MKRLFEHAPKFWAVCAIALGLWEGMAVGTRKVPTVTTTCRNARQNKLGAALIASWWLGLGYHLLRSKPGKVL